ncbi:type-4 uracil-DNA glycosylase [Methanofollis fontis]|uniref:Type-4 uracil-DNA glycosylase n=1 Tax=Methanofollis fontis TaxID=2052832 RepID=A0A483CST2_9EURY|nr:type-4 uracil-DNA glycosylase [Methanofollis fontis]TAJ44165.1 uracil-DNA glycosylase [Methanofollis fontis]
MHEVERLKTEILNCTHCPLSETRTHAVPGEGPKDAEIVFIGEAPGRQEDLQGRPFVGRAGRILDSMLDSAGISREEVFITNVVKCRPPENRDPQNEEIAACRPYLVEQISAIRPRFIVTLGRFAMRLVLEMFGVEAGSIGEMHGQVITVSQGGAVFTVIPMYHPAASIYNRQVRADLEDDFQTLGRLLRGE